MHTRLASAALVVLAIMGLNSNTEAQSTAYGSCPERADAYQARYETSGRVSDLVCMQAALERELSGSDRSGVYDCPQTSQHYQTAYERSGRPSDLVCMQTALERELR